MAARSVASTDTLETFRTTFNSLSATDIGDLATLSATIDATSLVGAINEIESEVSAFSVNTISNASDLGAAPATGDSFIIRDASANALREMTVANLFNTPSLTSPTITGTASVTGTLVFEGSTADSFETTFAITDPTADRTITFPNLTGTVSLITAAETLTNKTLTSPTINTATITLGANLTMGSNSIVFEGSTADSFETTITVTDPTADRTITLPNATDTLVGKATTDTLTNKTLTTPVIAEIDSGSTITLDATTDIVLDAGGGDVFLKDDGTTYGSLTNTSGNLIVKSGTTTAATFSGANVTLAGTVGSGAITSTSTVTGTGFVVSSGSIVFEGGTADSFETTLSVTDPTADRTITLPNETFKVASYANKATLDGDGSTVALTVGSGYNVNQFIVSINGVRQEPTEDFTYSGTTLTLDTAPGSGDRVVVTY
jgi:hypothetical protein